MTFPGGKGKRKPAPPPGPDGRGIRPRRGRGLTGPDRFRFPDDFRHPVSGGRHQGLEAPHRPDGVAVALDPEEDPQEHRVDGFVVRRVPDGEPDPDPVTAVQERYSRGFELQVVRAPQFGEEVPLVYRAVFAGLGVRQVPEVAVSEPPVFEERPDDGRLVHVPGHGEQLGGSESFVFHASGG